jgi:dTDP-4-dehydrorhamnose reductase
MTVLVFGGNGQVGQELLRALAPLGEVVATTRSGQLPDGGACEMADFGQPDSLPALLDRLQPSVVVNAAAYTAVDRAEQDTTAAFAANAEAPGVIARWCAAHGVPFVHYSTDYVFDGQGSAPYPEDEPTAPLGVYGTSKRDGEDAVRSAGGRHLIFRTAWVYASHGANFLRTMLRVGAERDQLRVVADQIGTPTPAALIADVTAQALQHPGQLSGTWHLTASGQTAGMGLQRRSSPRRWRPVCWRRCRPSRRFPVRSIRPRPSARHGRCWTTVSCSRISVSNCQRGRMD